MPPATIPAEGTVRSGFDVAKAGELVMIFDNTVNAANLLALLSLKSRRVADGVLVLRSTQSSDRRAST